METLSTRLQPIYSPLFWKAYFIQMRPYLLFISGIAGAAGIAMRNEGDTDMNKAILAFIPFFLGYGFGQALTDCFQTDTDKLSAPYRPLSKGILSIRSVLTVSIVGLLASGIILYLLHPFSFLLSGLAVFGLATYSYVKRHTWWAGPLYNAWIVALLPVMGYFAVSDSHVRSFPLHLIPTVMVSFFSYASFVLIGYLKDIAADEATGYKTFPVVWGWNKTMVLGDLIALATLSCFWTQHRSNAYEVLAGVAGSVIIMYAQLKGHLVKQKNEKGALLPILATVRSFILLHIAIVLHYEMGWWSYALLYYVLFEITLHNRPSRYQV
ncbi:MAG: UbiA family prenyltransferase [Flavisolibacter sp.]